MMRFCLEPLTPTAEMRAFFDALPLDARLYPDGAVTPARIVAEVVVRRMLSEQTGLPAARFRFSRTSFGKPYAFDAPHFNYSHSGQLFLCAVDLLPLGVDLETPRPISDRLIRRVCTPNELAFTAFDPRRFLQVWTAKEAYLKYLGRGLRTDPRTVDTVLDGELTNFGLQVCRAQTDTYTYTIFHAPRSL